MRSLPLTVVAVLWMPTAAAAIHAPSKAEWDEIKKLEEKGNDVAKTLEDHRQTRIGNSLPQDGKEEERLAFDRDVFYVQAIRLAERAYGLPPAPSGKSVVPGETKGRVVQWVLTAGDRDVRDIKDITGKHDKGYRVSGMDKGATTFPDGVTVVFPESFKSPGILALTLIHEQEHFVRNTTDANHLTAAENELSAREAEITAEAKAAFLQFESSKEGLAYLEDREKMAAQKAEEVRYNAASESSLRKFMRYIGRPLDVDLQHSTLSKEQLEAIRARMQAIDRGIEANEQARVEAERQAGEGQAAAEIRRQLAEENAKHKPLAAQPLAGPYPNERPQDEVAPAPSGPTAFPIARRTVLPDLRQLAQEACDRNRVFTQDFLDRHYEPEPERYSEESAGDLSGCARSLFFELAEANLKAAPDARFDAEWLNGRARALRPAPQSRSGGERSRPSEADPCRKWDPAFGGWVRTYPCP